MEPTAIPAKRARIPNDEKIQTGLYWHNIRVYDTGPGKFVDRYTVIYMDHPEGRGLFQAVGMSAAPFHPQGFGQHCSAAPGRHLGKRIRFDDLPYDCQRLVRADFTESGAEGACKPPR